MKGLSSREEPLQEAWRRGPSKSLRDGDDNGVCWNVTVHSPRQTERLASRLGTIVERGAVIVLDGDLGAGKTTFVRGLAQGLGLADGVVSSPTFTLIHEYEGEKPLYHFDAYRLEVPEEFFDLGAEEYLYGDGVCAIEWGANVRSELPPERLEIRIQAPMSSEDGASTESATGPGGRPPTHGCGGAEHWHMTEDELDESRRHIEMCARGPGPRAWLHALRTAWETGSRGTPSATKTAGASPEESDEG